MDAQKILFLRNFFLRTFVVGLVLLVLLFGLTFALEPVWFSYLPRAFGLEPEEVSEAMLASLLNARIVLIFMMLAPGVALHWLSKGKSGG
jgi:hypothetical protein